MTNATVSDSKVSLVSFVERSRRRLRDIILAREQMQQRALDRSLPRRRVDLGAKQIGDAPLRAFRKGETLEPITQF
jgi:hypothetical protein